MRTGIDEYSMILLLGMQSFLLLEEDKNCTRRERNSKNYQTCHKPKYAVHNDETKDRSTYGTSRPGDVTSLYAHELQRLLQALENWVTNVLTVF